MHIHMNPANMGVNGLAGAQSAETAAALRRARELRDAASKLKAGSLEVVADIDTDPETVAMITAWARGGSASNQSNQDHPGGSSEPSKTPAKIHEIRPAAHASPVSFWA